jgi:hypothetical protein
MKVEFYLLIELWLVARWPVTMVAETVSLVIGGSQ